MKFFYSSSQLSQPLTPTMKILRILVGLVVLGTMLTAAFFLFIYVVMFAAVF